MAAGPYSDKTIWRVDPSIMIVDPREDVFLVFHRLSGDTHILNFLSAGILETLEQNGQANFQTIAERIWEGMELSAEECPFELIERTTLELDDVGLVFPVAAKAEV